MKTFLIGLITNRVFLSAGGAWLIAQLSKNILHMVKGEFTPDRLTGSGGMPSAHSATVCGLAMSSLLVNGSHSTEFMIALFLAMIVIYDALGVRRTTGQQSRILNAMRKAASGKNAADAPASSPAEPDPLNGKPLEEHMGHTMPEIIVGIAIGIAAALIVHILPIPG